MMGVSWLILIWLALISLWGISKPGISAQTVKRLARRLRGLWLGGAGHPFDWAKD
jgi:hypothetical protein